MKNNATQTRYTVYVRSNGGRWRYVCWAYSLASAQEFALYGSGWERKILAPNRTRLE